MMFTCPVCDTPIRTRTSRCIGCERQLLAMRPPRANTPAGFFRLGLFDPLEGLRIARAWHRAKPTQASAAGVGAVLGALCWFALVVLTTILLAFVAILLLL